MTRSLFLVLCLFIFKSFDVCSSQNTVIVYFNTSTVTVEEGDIIDILLVAQGNLSKIVTVNLTFTDGTARYGMDYFYPPLITPSVTFTPGSISSSVFRVISIPNNIWEGPKSFEVGFVLPSDPNLSSCRPNTLRVNIEDDDSVYISFERSTQTVVEDSTGVWLQLQSRGLYGRRFSVSFHCLEVHPVEAKDGDDFTGGVYTVEFQNLDQDGTFSSTALIPIVDDSISEHTEAFFCVILRPRGMDGIVVEDSSIITLVIEDDDLIGVSFVMAVYSGEEGDIFTDIRLKATRPVNRAFDVQIFATTLDASRPEKDNEATSGVDYIDPLVGGGVVHFDPSILLYHSTSLVIPLLSDNFTECTEYFGLRFVVRSNQEDLGIIPVEPLMAVVAINDTNGECPKPVPVSPRPTVIAPVPPEKCTRGSVSSVIGVSFETAVYFGEEGSYSPEIRLKATEFEIPFRVQIFATTLDASRPEKEKEARSGVDYTDPRSLVGRGVVQFDPALGSLSTSLVIPLLSDNFTECTEYFGLHFLVLSNQEDLGTIPVEPMMAMVAINDTNGESPLPVPLVSFVKSNVTGGEGDVVNLRVKRTGSITRGLKCKVRIESTTAEKRVDFCAYVMTKSVVFNKLNADSEVKTVRVKLLSGNTNCFRVVLECEPRVLIGCKPSATVCTQGN